MSISDTRAVILSLLVLLAAYRILKVLRLAYDVRLQRIPGPWYAKYTHWVLKFHVLRGQRTPYIHRLHRQYGKFIRIAPNEIDVSDLAGFRQIHRIGTAFTKSPWYQQNSKKISNEAESSMFEVMNNKRHAVLRRINAPAFNPAAVSSYEPLVIEKVNLAVARLKTLASAAPADILKIWTFMTFDIITELAFGQSFGQLEQDQKTELLQKIEYYLIIGGVNNELPIVWPVLHLLAPFSTNIKELAMVFDRVHDDYGQIAVKNTRKALENKSPTSNPVMFAGMVAAAEKAVTNLARQDFPTSTPWLVLTHAEVKRKLLQEIANCPETMSFSDLSELTYLNNVMNETLRMWPAAPGSLYRMAPEAGYSFGEYEVPGLTRVNTQAWTFHRDPTFFPDPDTFDPDRWLNPTPQMQEAFMPFGAGARICIGMQFAKMELLHGAFAFFKACPNAIAVSSKADMEPVDYFLMKPRSLECLVTLK